MNIPGSRPLAYLGVFLLCGATLALEVALTRILALMMWHHFTYVVIGVALLGFGAAGSWMTMRALRRPVHESPDGVIAAYTLAAAVSTPLAYVMLTRIVFDPLAIVSDPLNLISLLLMYGVIAAPFFFAGAAVCGAISYYRANVGAVYFADLLGAGLGALAVPLLLEPLTGPGLVVALGSTLGVAAACFAFSDSRARGSVFGAVRAAAILVAALAAGWQLLPAARSGRLDPILPTSKDMALFQRANALETTRWSPLARIDVTKEGETVPMMGGVFRRGTPAHPLRGVFQDGAAPTMLLKALDEPGRMDFLKHSTTGSPFSVLRARGLESFETMAIGVGGGVDLQIALAHGARKVTGVEINAVTLDLLRDRYADYTGRLAERPQVELVHAEGRHFARASGRKFDLVQLSGVDTYTALNTGAYALSESYLYTQEAVGDFLDAVTAKGLVSYSRFVFPDKPRETLRLAATAVAALEERGVGEPFRHLFILYGDQAPFQWASVLIAREPFAPPDLDALRAFCAENGFPILFDPERPGSNRFDDCLRGSAADRSAFFAAYPYDVRPARDDRPFFFNFFKWSGLLQPAEFGGHVYKDTYPIGHLMLVIALLQTTLLGAIFILRPLRGFDRGIGDGTTRAALLYFSALGMGFIALEIALMQRLVLFLGHPTYALTVVLPVMLVCAGVGALTVTPSTPPMRRLRLVAMLAPLLIVATWWATTYQLGTWLDRPFAMRVAIAAIALAPVSVVLGMAFPSAIRLLDARRPELVPWAWGVNGFTSVLGSTGAVVLAMETGFSAVMLATAGIYLIGLVALLWAFRTTGAPTEGEGAMVEPGDGEGG